MSKRNENGNAIRNETKKRIRNFLTNFKNLLKRFCFAFSFLFYFNFQFYYSKKKLAKNEWMGYDEKDCFTFSFSLTYAHVRSIHTYVHFCCVTKDFFFFSTQRLFFFFFFLRNSKYQILYYFKINNFFWGEVYLTFLLLWNILIRKRKK